jgi:hypothetical protein
MLVGSKIIMAAKVKADLNTLSIINYEKPNKKNIILV